jgi:hypothetical protein
MDDLEDKDVKETIELFVSVGRKLNVEGILKERSYKSLELI